MKSYNGLYKKMMEPEQIKKAIEEAARHRSYTKEVQNVLTNIDKKVAEIERDVKLGWTPPKHEITILKEGSHKKTREIQKPCWDDEQIVHHMLMRQLRPIIMKSLHPYALGSVPKRGTHYALKKMVKWRDKYNGKKFYVAELDIKHFYQSIDINILKQMLKKRIRDKDFLAIMFAVLDAGAPGLPLGFYTSPWLSHFILTPLDYYISQDLKPDHYLRYADNMFLFHKNKKELHKMVKMIELYLNEVLHLRIKEDWQVYRFETYNRKKRKITGRVINALGFIIHRNRVGIRKSILCRARRKVRRTWQRHHLPIRVASAIISYMGYFKYSNTYNYFQKYIKPHISIHYCKKRIKFYNRKELMKSYE